MLFRESAESSASKYKVVRVFGLASCNYFPHYIKLVLDTCKNKSSAVRARLFNNGASGFYPR